MRGPRTVLGVVLVAAWVPACSSAGDGAGADDGTGAPSVETGGTTTVSGGSTGLGGMDNVTSTAGTGGTVANGGAGGTTSSSGTGGTAGKGGGSGSGGSTGKGGATGTGGSTLVLPDAGSPNVQVTACPANATGAWENITPSLPTRPSCGFGIDPQNPSTLYLGTGQAGIYKSTDCGASWTKSNTGTNGALLDQGEGWDVQVDWDATHSVYANSGYGPNGYFKSTDGGKSWQQILDSKGAGAAFIYGGFVHHTGFDPTTPGHFILAPHFSCEGGNSGHCLLEMSEGGAKWTVAQNAPPEDEEGSVSMLDAKTWFQGDFGGLNRTADEGKSWTQVVKSGELMNPVYATGPDGTLYVVGSGGLRSSTDRGATWTKLRDGGMNSVAASPTDLYIQIGMTTYQVASFGSLGKWDALKASNAPPGGPFACGLKYDKVHHLLYVLNQSGGLWRFVAQ
jgi:photosystem II stability/assembly factor-like uncharacterized protein